MNKGVPKLFLAITLPPPFNGQSIGSQLVMELICKDFEAEVFKLNVHWYLTDNAGLRSKIKYYSYSAWKYFSVILSVWKRFIIRQPDLLYIVPSSNLKGLLRDLLIYVPFLFKGSAIICHVRSGEFDISQVFFRSLYSRNNFHFIFLTNILSKKSGVLNHNLSIVPNFVDECFESTERRGLNNRAHLKILYLSNLFASKGILHLIHAVMELSNNLNVELHIYGKGEDIIIEKIKSLERLSDRINFHGEVTNRLAVKELYMNNDIFALPTTYKVEASPRSIIESMSQGCVPLVTDHAGIPDMVDESCAFIIDRNKNIKDQLKLSIESICNDRAKLIEKSLAAREVFSTKFSRSIILQNLTGVIKNKL